MNEVTDFGFIQLRELPAERLPASQRRFYSKELVFVESQTREQGFFPQNVAANFCSSPGIIFVRITKKKNRAVAQEVSLWFPPRRLTSGKVGFMADEKAPAQTSSDITSVSPANFRPTNGSSLIYRHHPEMVHT
jgi:hypothetical protein